MTFAEQADQQLMLVRPIHVMAARLYAALLFLQITGFGYKLIVS